MVNYALQSLVAGVIGMYNQERKAEFLSALGKFDTIQASVLFNASEKFETDLGKDICEFDEEDMAKYAPFSIRPNSFRQAEPLLFAYLDWCAGRGIPTSGLTKENLRVDFAASLRASMFSSPTELHFTMEKVFSPVSEGGVDCVYRGLTWLIYGGITLKDALGVLSSEVDLTNMLVRGRYEIYREAVPTFRALLDLKTFRYDHPSYSIPNRERAPGPELLRGFRGVSSYVTLVNVLMKAFRDVKPNFSIIDTRTSGDFYRMFVLERMGVKPDFYYMDGKRNRKSAHAASKRMETDYAEWKKAFSVD